MKKMVIKINSIKCTVCDKYFTESWRKGIDKYAMNTVQIFNNRLSTVRFICKYCHNAIIEQ